MSVIKMLLKDYRNEILEGSHLDEAAALLAIESEFYSLQARLEKAVEENYEKGEVVVTTNESGDCVAVTRQDDDHKVIKVIWQKK